MQEFKKENENDANQKLENLGNLGNLGDTIPSFRFWPTDKKKIWKKISNIS